MVIGIGRKKCWVNSRNCRSKNSGDFVEQQFARAKIPPVMCQTVNVQGS